MAYSSFVPNLIPIWSQSHGLIQLIQKYFLGHSSVSRIKQNSSIQRFPCGSKICLTTPNEILELLRQKTAGFDLSLLKQPAHTLRGPLSKAINNNLWQGVPPDDTKIALVSSLDKGTSKNNEISNFKPVII